MAKTCVRIRCPSCGMQVDQNRLNKDYLPLEMSWFESRGRGKLIWHKNVEGTGKFVLLLALRTKLKRLLAKVEILLSGSETTELSVLAMSASPSSLGWMDRSTFRSSRTNAVQKRVASSLTISSEPPEKA